MAPTARRKAFRRSIISLATAYAEQAENEGTEDDLVIPEDLTALSVDELQTLAGRANDAFEAVYGDGTADLDDDQYTALSVLTVGIEALGVELDAREQLAAERRNKAAELAARVRGDEPSDTAADSEALAAKKDKDDEDEDKKKHSAEVEAGAPAAAAAEPAAVVASVATAERPAIRVNMANVRSRASRATAAAAPALKAGDGYNSAEEVSSIGDIMYSNSTGLGFESGASVDFDDLGRAIDKRLQSFNESAYAKANKNGRHLRDQHSLAVIKKPFSDDLIVRSNDLNHVEEVFNRAVDESRLPGGSLVASGGWCAPSEVIYDLIGEVESRDGLLSLPEIGVTRGGVSFTRGPDFADIFSEIVGFSYTEQNDIDGEYAVDANGVGTGEAGNKPCYKIECPPFVEYRLGIEGLCLSAGLLQQRGYPEVIARTIRGALVAHDHRVNGRMIAAMVAGSTAITMAANQVGTIAPILTAVELQVEHYRAVRRMSRNTTLEAVFPFWVRGAIRSDLSRRLGIDPDTGINVTDAQITDWFNSRGISPQFVYNWQDIAGTAATAFTQWPTSVQFLLYSAGTWVRGTSDIITIDTLYDSVLLGQNDYTALFTEEGVFTARRGQDSRVVTVPITADGATAAGVDIAHNGSLVPAV
ncbi:major head protein [Microbacterium phage Hendrix]|uniref:Major capsid hexamer protein n=1 Tax=Microbacterium phage Hendrix TaxID=2182341 RepID=A0A2U8UU87_9CAUD|nr:major head protein [Microbacterium phage Hendrix]AWN07728.1 major capsid hexamer protein [Microbacterium phage Hendrix]